ncbi:MAG: 2-C-methyl-D-erythritol 4-phosphate cytidylyltransferase [Candidatus Dormibacteraeota bacterium]|nr:2-C-methyl-D-erythritol 4-phosphate cytidylyltransferase [Candidatus Dormibacteraeota bacterium]MBV9525759.1 2-C-methyl-D-erythritol 4-phosphate cytidylyltransferase [Candidatus Dormibacteraeota bacterium]
MGQDKLWLDVHGTSVVGLTLRNAGAAGCFDRLVLAAPAERGDALRSLASAAGFLRVDVVEGGPRRQDSVYAALQRVEDEFVCVHDAARPLAPPQLFRDVLAVAQAQGASTAAIACVDTVKRAHDGHIVETLPRAELIATQTPQAFSTYLLKHAHEAARADDVEGDDDSYLVERLGQQVAVVPGDPRNIKVTHEQDLRLVRALLESPV